MCDNIEYEHLHCRREYPSNGIYDIYEINGTVRDIRVDKAQIHDAEHAGKE